MWVLLAVLLCIVNASGQIPESSQCEPPTCSTRAASCSTNPGCDCLALSLGLDGVCAAALPSCSYLTPCSSDNVTCTVSCTVCVINTRCNKPMCYPLALAVPQVCPPLNSSTTTTTTRSVKTTQSATTTRPATSTQPATTTRPATTTYKTTLGE
ncbi:unnamed protein product [Rotaria magnacalcarata]|uniref:Uncharacterized protein n=3 Tax=Rotaria magnacalcarata TaxID=392030 RepID=A0A816VPR9_9BILA|nr:unnamed protein product [Rotaria magnacalcarata]CAF2122856.1 unnamed protein product [Rotaria magnacalcarata]CAF4876832.1 unnamed protein product [Rotaria magnacalcarata]